jgi:Cell wall-active antibiotics response 4TMS YvqF
VAIFGEVELDLREALLQSGRIVVYATLIAGTIHLIVPDGVSVETRGTAVLVRTVYRTVRQPGPRWSAVARPGPGQGGPGTAQPVVEVRTVGFGGTIKVTSPKRPRRLGGLRRGMLPRG